MAYQLIALDMDGTLLDGAKRVLPSSTEAIEEALAAGRHVAICSGRCPAMVEVSRDELAGIRYAICGSGTSLYDLDERRLLWETRLDHDALVRILDACEGTGMLALAELLGVPREATMAVGDADNDLPMLRDAGLGVAMGNANERVRAAADVVVADNDHGGVAEAIRTYLLGSAH